ncbi:MAG TPA: peptide-methionine (S)-S-oxide reductase MsrA [bacterium]|nr:peptide-methionine (S)-S-oxide reductase MsrA [bacterium]
MEKATFAAGCFWGVEKFFMEIPGVISTQVGYAGGRTENPTYEEICTGRTGHTEAVEITFDPAKVSYPILLITFWQFHDPTTPNRQGPDIGSQYRSVIFYHSEDQKKMAEQSRDLLDQSGVFKLPIVTEIIPAAPFHRAEEYHQRYLKKNPYGYCSHHLQSTKIAHVLKPMASGK